MKRLFLVAVLLVLPHMAKAQADPNRSDFWLRSCGEENQILCLGYVSGFKDALGSARAIQEGLLERDAPEDLPKHKMIWDYSYKTMLTCEEKITNGQRVEVWMKYLRDHPEMHHEPPFYTYMKSQQAFQCD